MAKTNGSKQALDFGDCAVIVAHPDDETLWAGGAILLHPEAMWTIITLCRGSDPDRAPKFSKALEALGATGVMGDLDDGPEQPPLSISEMQKTILELLPSDRFDLVITHGIWGEYTKHLRHEETHKAVMSLRRTDRLRSKEVWSFAYEDGGGKYLPRPILDADITIRLPEDILQKKLEIITAIYGFSPESFEAKIVSRLEAFWQFS